MKHTLADHNLATRFKMCFPNTFLLSIAWNVGWIFFFFPFKNIQKIELDF